MKLLQWIVDLLYPQKCAFCRKLLGREETDLCGVCREELPRCDYGFRRGKHYENCYCVCFYEKHVKDSVRRFKFSGQSQYAEVYGRLMAMTILEKRIDFDVITWVPLSKQRQRSRGYCQTKLLAQTIARELGVVPTALLEKICDNKAQSSLKNFSEREMNVKNVYRAVNTESFANKTVLLIDDVITSGSTLSECSRILKNSGAKSIVCVTFAATRE